MKIGNVEIPVMHCYYCGYEWMARRTDIPKYCPQCKRPTDGKPKRKECK